MPTPSLTDERSIACAPSLYCTPDRLACMQSEIARLVQRALTFRTDPPTDRGWRARSPSVRGGVAGRFGK